MNLLFSPVTALRHVLSLAGRWTFAGLLAGAVLPHVAQAQLADMPIMERLRDEFDFDIAYGWPAEGNCCPDDTANWPGVTCSAQRVSAIALGAKTGLPRQDVFPGAELAQLPFLQILELRISWFTPIAASKFSALGGMTQLRQIRFDANPGITGTLADIFPNGFGGFPALAYVDFSATSLSGPIPVDAFAPGRSTVLAQCSFTGAPPANGPANFNEAKLHGNLLEGVPPVWLRDDGRTATHDRSGNYPRLTVPLSSLRYNKFDVANTPPCVMDTTDPGWRDTQTVPPTAVQVTATTPTTATLSWTPIGYQAHGGYYEVLSATQPGGPYTSRGTTAESGQKTATALTVGGLSSSQTHYFVVRTFTPAHVGGTVLVDGTIVELGSIRNYTDNPNDLTSVNSAEVSAATLEAPSLVVTTTSDTVDATDNQTSLREAIAHANSGNVGASPVITFSDGTGRKVNFSDGTARTITLGGTELAITSSVTIIGPGADKLSVSGNDASRVLHFTNSGATSSLQGLTITEGRVVNFTLLVFGGGGIRNLGTLRLVDCAISGNTVTSYAGTTGGAGIENNGGTLVAIGVTISGNVAQGGARTALAGGCSMFTAAR